MREAAIVSAARTPIGRAFRGAFNQTEGATMAGHVVAAGDRSRAASIRREVDDVIIGCGLPEGATGNNIGRTAALRAGCPVSVPGQTVSRFCASGLDAIAAGAKRVIADGADIVVAGGVESISMVQNDVHVRVPYRRVAFAPRARSLHADALYRRFHREEIQRLARAPGRIRTAEPAAHRGRASGGALRRRDRAAPVVEVRRESRETAR